MRAARCDSVFCSVACCFSWSIWTIGDPERTTSPDLTKTFVTRPSTCGCTVVELSDRTVEMKSDDTSMGLSCSVMTPTAAAPRPPPAGPAAGAPPPPRLQAPTAVRMVKVMMREDWLHIKFGVTLDLRLTRAAKGPVRNTKATPGGVALFY